MQLNSNYAFSKLNYVGQASGTVTTSLAEGKTVKGEPVVALCDDNSFNARKDGAALVSRNAEGEWQPVTSMKQLQETFAATPKESLGEQVGIWTDGRRWVVKGPDGVPQNDEVQTLQSHWDDQASSSAVRFQDLGVRNDDPNRAPEPMTVGWSFADSHVRANEVSVTPATYPNGKVGGLLNEPLYVDSHEILRVTEFNDQGDFTPSAVESTKHAAGVASSVTPNAEYDLAPLIYDYLPTENVKP